jgi:hypothetical protein
LRRDYHNSKPEFIEEQFNIRMASRQQVYERLYEHAIAPQAGFQQLILPFLTGLKTVTTETTPSQSDYAWAHWPYAAAGEQPKALAQVGDASSLGIFLLQMHHTQGKVSRMVVRLLFRWNRHLRRYIEENAFTSSLPLQASTPMNAKLAQIYVDPTWANVGVTELTDALDEFTAEILTGLHPVFRGSTTNYFNSHREGIIGYTATFVVEHALRDELLASQQAGDLQIVRLKLNGPQIGTGVNHSLIMDMGGAWEDVTPRTSDRSDNYPHSPCMPVR